MTEEAKRKSDYWFELATDDLDVAKTMLASRKYLYVGFFCHLLVEKGLKAHFWRSHGKEPPYTHNLQYIAEKAGLSNALDEGQFELLDRLMPMQIAGRYPTDKYKLLKSLNEEISLNMIADSERFLNWLKQLKA